MCENLKNKIIKCHTILRKGYLNSRNTGLSWLDEFCSEFLQFANCLHSLLETEPNKCAKQLDDQLNTIYLCLTQILTCVRHMEKVLKAEISGGTTISASREHFLDRMLWCLDKLCDLIGELSQNTQMQYTKQLEENNFVELVDMVLARLHPYCYYEEEDISNEAENIAEAMFASKHIRSLINVILSQTLAFANVALKEDKKALSALCQKALRECIAFQEECEVLEKQIKLNHSVRKLKAISLENALYQLEDFINEALLRLVFTCFLDFDKFSIDKLRAAVRSFEADDPQVDELIADFDVNVDRTTQIGIFAIAFATNIKVKTVIRSCLASFESLDTCIIPSLHSSNAVDIHSEILEQHFNEETAHFKKAMQEIIDSHAFVSCFYEMIASRVKDSEKDLIKSSLMEIIQMGEFVCEHFALKVNAKELLKSNNGEHLFGKFTLILNECRAIMQCCDQVDKRRVLKRFKILRSTTQKLLGCLSDENVRPHKAQTNMMLLSDELSDSQQLFESIGISPSICSILYVKNSARRTNSSASMKVNSSILLEQSNRSLTTDESSNRQAQPSTCRRSESKSSKHPKMIREVSGILRRKESLRTAMFKRQKSLEADKVYKMYKSCSSSLQISEILDELVDLTTSLKESNTDHLNTTIVL